MGSTTIGWTSTVLPNGTELPGYTANFWLGCARVSPACERCYAETFVVGRMKLPVWGPPSTTERHRAKGVWRDVPRWNREAQASGVRRKVFVSSLSDIFEDHPQVAPWRVSALALLENCPALDVLLLTKRPENIRRMVSEAWLRPGHWPAHVWVGTTVEDQKRANERIPELLEVPARVRFLSMEPLLEAVNLFRIPVDDMAAIDALRGALFCEGRNEALPIPGIDWVLVGGESGPGHRILNVDWITNLVEQCQEAKVPVFVKQDSGARPGRKGRISDELWALKEFPR